jgi:hypothetical protein
MNYFSLFDVFFKLFLSIQTKVTTDNPSKVSKWSREFRVGSLFVNAEKLASKVSF